MKILHSIFSMQIGGAELMLVDIINEQIKQGHKIGLIIVNNNYNEKLLSAIHPNADILFVDRKEGSKNILNLIKLNRLVKHFNPDVIHAHDFSFIKLLFFNHSFKVLTVHDVGIESEFFKNYDLICVISDSVKKYILDNTKIVPEVVYNGVDFNKIQARDNTDTTIPDFRIVQISRLEYLKKGQDILIKALYRLKQKEKTCKITVDFIGEGSSLCYLKELVSKYDLKENINFLGAKDRTFIYENLHNYDLLVQPSRYEGFGLTVVEAMAAKVPVLVSNIDGPNEIIQNGKYGFYFKNEDSDDCADVISDIMNTEDMSTFVYQAYLYAYENFNIEKTALRYLQLYQKGIS